MASATQHEDDGITGINVTPLVDVTLVLLIIFMVTAKLIAGQGIPLDLPKAATAAATQTTLTIGIRPDGTITANGEAVAGGAPLTAEARRALQKNPELRTVISASAVVEHGKVMEIVDTLRAAGATKIAFAADKPEKGARER